MVRIPETRMSASEVGKKLGMAPIDVMNALRRGAFPFGTALPPDDLHERWRYIIPRSRFEAWVQGKDLAYRD